MIVEEIIKFLERCHTEFPVEGKEKHNLTFNAEFEMLELELFVNGWWYSFFLTGGKLGQENDIDSAFVAMRKHVKKLEQKSKEINGKN